MPTYEYECKACGKTFEVFQKMSDEPLKTCICCKKKPVRRKIGTGAGIIFKGSGFYCTDYRKDSYKSAQKADTASQSSSSASTSSSTSSTSSSSKSDKSEAKSTK
ncbi:MAG TPA: FmdB family transcriptional regulator [Lentisphaeria bacterium]|nr:MAG: FmdB family transcriptional regulator [Lentisphaerae bacterium GWF2_50_93]HCE45708.1 FmdB family transcriptional regulator [Lentisphaeria bacterium]